jgi:hypothetical protein
MIHHEARTRTIRECTGLSDDRIRKLFGRYFQGAATRHIKRRRGKSPRQVGRFVKSPLNQLEATTLIILYCSGLLLRMDSERKIQACWPRPDVDYGHRVCRAFETYLLLHPGAKLSFEWAWNLLQTISHNDELYLAACDNCNTAYVQDSYALDHRVCPSCEISRQSGRRPQR